MYIIYSVYIYIYIDIHIANGKLTYIYGSNSPFLLGKLTISMAILTDYVKLPEGIYIELYIERTCIYSLHVASSTYLHDVFV